MNFTWFASAFDNDGLFYRLTTLLIIFGALVMAAGLEIFLANSQAALVVGLGYVIMRIGMITMWIRAAIGSKEHRQTAIFYAVGITIAQIYWMISIFLFPPNAVFIWAPIGWVIELSVPFFAEKLNRTPWHRHHIIERYGLLNIIVLGEVLLAVVAAFLKALKEGHLNIGLIYMAIAAFVIT